MLIPVDIFQSIGTEVVLEDEAVPPENTKKLAAALKAQGIAYEAHIIRECPMVSEQQKACLQRAGSIRR